MRGSPFFESGNECGADQSAADTGEKRRVAVLLSRRALKWHFAQKNRVNYGWILEALDSIIKMLSQKGGLIYDELSCREDP